jgi:hypothetical protein
MREPAPEPLPELRTEPGTPSLAQGIKGCWLRPRLLADELAWRWGYGIPALLLVFEVCRRIYRQARPALIAAGLPRFSFTQVNQSAYILARMMQTLKPVLAATALWLLPVLGVGWVLAFGFGRMTMLRRYAPELPRRPWTLAATQALRLGVLAVMVILWWQGIQWAAFHASNGGRAPDLTAYFGWVFLISLALFVLWMLLSVVFYAAPLLLLLEGHGVAASLAQSLRPGAWRGPVAQANLGLSLIRLALAALSIVLSAIPVLFGLTGLGLYLWWAAVTVLYLVASAFLAVVRQGIFIEFWKSTHSA